MFIVSMKANKKKILAAVLIFLACIVGLLLYRNYSANVKADKQKAASVVVQTNAQRVEYLASFGWEVSDEADIIAEVAIPESFSDVYKQYNKLQKQQGFDLESYKGKRAKRFTYEVLNYKTQLKGIRANLLVYNNQIIAGDVCSIELNGFMHGLKMPA